MTTLEHDPSAVGHSTARPGAMAQGGPTGNADTRRLKLPLAPSLERRRLQSYLMLVILDGLALTVGFLFTAYIYLGDIAGDGIAEQWAMLLPVYWTAALSLQAYAIGSLTSLRTSQKRALVALLAALTFTLFVAFFAKSSQQYSRITTGFGVVATAALLMWVRTLIQPLIRLRCGDTAENVLVFDDGGAPLRVPHAWHIDTTEHRLSPNCQDPHMLDRLGMFMANMDRVLVTCPPERRMEWALVFKGSSISGEIVDRDVTTLGVLGARRGLNYGSLVVSTGPLGLRNRVAKRLMDLAVAGGALLFLAPLLALIAIFIKLEDGGPILFLQQRQGRNNRLFWIYKFRSMRVEKLDGAGSRSASKDDDRITRIGRFIRRTSIDELPQVINVLKGDMSIVGPRPHAIGSLAGSKRFWEVDSRYLLRHSLKPGLTGLAQIRGLRGATDSEQDLSDRLQADLEYLDGWTVWRDMRIIMATVTVLVHDRAF